MLLKVKKGDTVQMLAGKDRGKRGLVARVFPRADRLIVDGLNIVKKHRRARKSTAPSGIIAVAAPVPIARVIVVCPHCSKPPRVAMRIESDGSRHRICKHCHESLAGEES